MATSTTLQLESLIIIGLITLGLQNSKHYTARQPNEGRGGAKSAKRSVPGIELGTSSTLRKNHTTRPNRHVLRDSYNCIITHFYSCLMTSLPCSSHSSFFIQSLLDLDLRTRCTEYTVFPSHHALHPSIWVLLKGFTFAYVYGRNPIIFSISFLPPPVDLDLEREV